MGNIKTTELDYKNISEDVYDIMIIQLIVTWHLISIEF